MSAEPLRRKAVRAGVHLTLRRIIGLGLSFIGTLFLTRILGPESYGAYAAATATLGYFLAVGLQGGRIYLIRLPEDASDHIFSIVFWWLFAFSIVAASLLTAVGAIISWQTGGNSLYASVLMMVAFTLVGGSLRGVFAARLERNLDYAKLALVELSGQVMSYAVAIPIALRGGGVTALIAGQWSAELLQLIVFSLVTRFRPKWVGNRTQIRDVVQESLKLSSGAWAYELRYFTVPLILLPLAGERGVGYYALAQRLISSLTMVSDAIAQLSLPIYARLQQRLPELMQAIYRSAQAQLIGFGAIATLAIIAGYPVLWLIYRAKWDVNILVLTMVFLCVHTMLFIIFGAQAQAMYIIRKTNFMLWLNMLLIACLFPFTWLFTWLAPAPYKPVGFMLGYLLAHQPDHLLLHRAVNRWIGKPIYGMNLIWAAGLGAAMFAPFTGYWSLLGLLVFLHPASLRAAREIVGLLKEARGAKNEATQG